MLVPQKLDGLALLHILNTSMTDNINAIFVEVLVRILLLVLCYAHLRVKSPSPEGSTLDRHSRGSARIKEGPYLS
jgi:hypothetical protein